jgi:hypothetical protein
MFKAIATAAAMLALPVAASAAQVSLAPSNVVGSSGYYTACCNFNPGSILDQQAGTVTESFGAGYWLNPDNGPSNAYITVKLGTGTNGVSLTGLDLYNTHNGNYGDRGTGNFSIYGSNHISGGQLVAPTLILSGTLTAATVAGPLVAQTFAASGTYRYISFNPTSVSTAPDGAFGNGVSCCGANVYGLNELRVFGSETAVPEPQSWILLIAGFGLVGAAMRRKAMLTA